MTTPAQMYHHYRKWEGFLNGLYQPAYKDADVAAAATILANRQQLYDAMKAVVEMWVVSCEQHLSNTDINRRAWLGQAACCLATGVSANATKQAWHTLSRQDQAIANVCADSVISLWELQYRRSPCQSGQSELMF